MRLKAIVPGLVALGLAGVLATGVTSAQDKKEKKKAVSSTLKPGDKAPSFEAPDDTGKTWKSSDVVGKKVLVMFFFPAALTGG